MGINPSSDNRQQPILRPLTPRSNRPRIAAMVGLGFASAMAGAVAVIVYTNAVSNPKLLDASAGQAQEIVASIATPAETARPDEVAGNDGILPAAAREDDVLPAAEREQASAPGSTVPEPVPAQASPVLAKTAETPAEPAFDVNSALQPKPVKTMTIAAAPTVPAPGDPRWSGEPPVTRNKALAVLREKIAASGTEEQAAPAETALALADPGDDSADPTVQLEAEAARTLRDTAAPAKKAQPKRMATITQAVNMRTSGSSKAAVVMVVPAKAEVGLAGCKGWCEITYKGKRGYVWKEFIRPGSAARPLNALAGG
ncbi:MAG: hypothetical protein KDJ73_12045 [Notoacmeibacter sp.]|nr:hypothetical protein [Notoacmeibacter sp.]MCC0032169.1 hypothetical protein [Brucellaceae bacterium]